MLQLVFHYRCFLTAVIHNKGKKEEFAATGSSSSIDKLPSYFIFAGLVFVPLTQPYLHEYGEEWYNTSPRRLCECALRELPKQAGEQLIVLSQVLMDDINAGYERLAELQVKKVNGIEIDNLKHLCQLVENCSRELED
ncbi:hypothetical protein CRYUN_Cryun16bG0062400 [Craigia yunnanensis]